MLLLSEMQCLMNLLAHIHVSLEITRGQQEEFENKFIANINTSEWTHELTSV